MFKLPGFPNFKDDVFDLVDFVEVRCIVKQKHQVSYREIHRLLSYGEDEVEISGIEDENDIFDSSKFDEISGEIQRRMDVCGKKYPFEIAGDGHTLKLTLPINNWYTLNYLYLLLATRLDMQKNRRQNGIDGSLLFEKFSAQIAKNYWGNRAESTVFGTGKSGGFQDKVNELCSLIGEGTGFSTRNSSQPTEKDGKLDVVVWKNFQDGKPSKLIGFGQCKTGTNWEEPASQLQPDTFCKSWFKDMPVISPIRLYFICDSFPIHQWFSKASTAGLIFDRYRIMDFLPDSFDEELNKELKNWVEAALNFVRQSG